MASIKEVYKEVESEKDDSVTMELKDFIAEHKNLLKILRNGSKKELLAEADSQEKELAKYLP
jgi:hypothetical protein